MCCDPFRWDYSAANVQAVTDAKHGANLVLAELCRIDVEEGGRGEPAPRPLADINWVLSQLADKRPALFLDYDGTLTPIVERPEDARLSTDMRQTLRDGTRAARFAGCSRSWGWTARMSCPFISATT